MVRAAAAAILTVGPGFETTLHAANYPLVFNSIEIVIHLLVVNSSRQGSSRDVRIYAARKALKKAFK